MQPMHMLWLVLCMQSVIQYIHMLLVDEIDSVCKCQIQIDIHLKSMTGENELENLKTWPKKQKVNLSPNAHILCIENHCYDMTFVNVKRYAVSFWMFIASLMIWTESVEIIVQEYQNIQISVVSKWMIHIQRLQENVEKLSNTIDNCVAKNQAQINKSIFICIAH